MADKDAVTKAYMQDSAVFADAFNFLLFDGRQVIRPEQLRPLDTTAIVLPYGADGTSVPDQKYRDVLKLVTAMEDDRAAYLLLGIENQSQIHYAMPVRHMLYDAMQYAAQVEATAKSHRGDDAKAQTSAEFLSGFYRTDKLLPVITLTLYFGAEQWNAPRCLHDMLAVEEAYLPFVEDYRLHLIVPADIADEDFSKFHTELNLALKYVKYSKDKQRLREIVREDDAYQDVSRNTADLVNVVTGSRLPYQKEKERVNMCLAIEEMRNDAREEGREEGRREMCLAIEEMRNDARMEGREEGRREMCLAIEEMKNDARIEGREEGRMEGRMEGREEGRMEGRMEGREEGREEGIFSTLTELVGRGMLSAEQAAEVAHVTVDEFQAKMGLQQA